MDRHYNDNTDYLGDRVIQEEREENFFFSFYLCIFNLLQQPRSTAVIFKMQRRRADFGFPGSSVAQNLPANAGYMSSIPGLGISHMLQSS